MESSKKYEEIRKSLISSALSEIETITKFICFLKSNSDETNKFLQNSTEEMKIKEPKLYKEMMEKI